MVVWLYKVYGGPSHAVLAKCDKELWVIFAFSMGLIIIKL